VVLLLSLHENDAKEKRKVLKAVSNFPGSFAPFLYPLRFFLKKNWTEFFFERTARALPKFY